MGALLSALRAFCTSFPTQGVQVGQSWDPPPFRCAPFHPRWHPWLGPFPRYLRLVGLAWHTQGSTLRHSLARVSPRLSLWLALLPPCGHPGVPSPIPLTGAARMVRGLPPFQGLPLPCGTARVVIPLQWPDCTLSQPTSATFLHLVVRPAGDPVDSDPPRVVPYPEWVATPAGASLAGGCQAQAYPGWEPTV